MIGKSTLLKMIANNLHTSKEHIVGGTVSMTGVTTTENLNWTNLVSYIDQIDRLHPFLTVFETCRFAWLCRTGGTHRRPHYGEGEEVDETIKKMDDELYMINKILDAVGLTRVKDTFVGGEGIVRGVSGGEKKRVTVAEMLCIGTPVICCDEISTGLDGMFICYDNNSGVWLLLCCTLTVFFLVFFQLRQPLTLLAFSEKQLGSLVVRKLSRCYSRHPRL
jgi:ABC-type multidrug transport system ATPase subunit